MGSHSLMSGTFSAVEEARQFDDWGVLTDEIPLITPVE